jgi:hypothetical protein
MGGSTGCRNNDIAAGDSASKVERSSQHAMQFCVFAGDATPALLMLLLLLLLLLAGLHATAARPASWHTSVTTRKCAGG